MKPFRERNPVVVGVVSIATLVLLLVAALRADSLPLIGSGDVIYAEFSEAGGLSANDEVRIAGVRIGKVDSIELSEGVVRVGMRIDTDVDLGDTTKAEIRVKTLLGSMFIMLVPGGEGDIDAGDTIDVDRTSSPFDIVEAFTGLAETSADIDTDQLAVSLTTLADLTRNTPEEFRSALEGVSALSTAIASRDAEINSLLQNLERVSSVLDARDEDIIALMDDADVLFRALLQRREAVHNLLVSTSTLSKELTALVRETKADLNPALEHLASVVDVINKNEDNLDNALRLMAPFYRYFASTLGGGPWFDTYLFNLPPVPSPDGGGPQ